MNAITGTYRLVYVQPEPEVGDRVCVGLVLEEHAGRFSLLYDRHLRKLRCVAPKFDFDLLRFFLEDLGASVSDSKDIESTIRRYGPQVTISSARAVNAPIAETTKIRLLERFTMSAPHVPAPLTERETARKTAERHVVEYVVAASRPYNLPLLPSPSPDELFGRPVPRLEPVAAAIRGRHGMLLVDGVDLNALKPATAVSVTNKIVHNFWQYARLCESDLAFQQLPMRRVGIVLNGAAVKSDAYSEAHDYAMDQFQKGAEIAIDAGSPVSAEQLARLLMAESAAR